MDFYSIMLFLLLGLIPVAWLKLVKNYSFKKTAEELFPKPKPIGEELIGGFSLFVLLVISFLIVSIALSVLNLNDLEKVSEIISAEKENMLWFSILMVIAVFFEEYFFRSFLIKRFSGFFLKIVEAILGKSKKTLAKKIGPFLGIIISTLIFAFAHAGYDSVAQIIGAFLLGLVLAYWFYKKNSLLQNFLGHTLYNLLALVIYFAFV